MSLKLSEWKNSSLFEMFTTQVQFWRNEDGNYEGCASVNNCHKKNWAAFHTKIVSPGSPKYSVQGGTSILRPNGQKKIRFFADEGQFSVADKAEISIFSDSSELNLKSMLRANQNNLKEQLKPITPSETVLMQFQLVDAPKPKLKLAHQCDLCQKPFAYKEAMLSHKKQKHEVFLQQLFQCTYCDFKGAKTKRAHEAHEKRHLNPPVKKAAQHQCDQCGRKFYGEKQLAVHIEKRHREHLCRLACGEKFSDKIDERKHFMNKHKQQDSEVPPPCKICGKEFSWNQGLQKHLRKSRCGEILKKQQQDKVDVGKDDVGKEDVGKEDVGKEDVGKEDVGKEDVSKKDVGKEDDGVRGGDVGDVFDSQRLQEVNEKEDGIIEKDGEEVGQKKGKSGDGKRGMKRKIQIEVGEECDYEKIRRRNIKERKEFLAAMGPL